MSQKEAIIQYNLNKIISTEKLPEPIRNPIENQPYFKAVDRLSGEQILQNRVDGSCLIRPYKEQVKFK